jgi:hypothetical protein
LKKLGLIIYPGEIVPIGRPHTGAVSNLVIAKNSYRLSGKIMVILQYLNLCLMNVLHIKIHIN